MAGSHALTVTDSNGCSDDATTNVVVVRDDTAVAVGRNSSGQCNVGSWTDIVQVAAGGSGILFGLIKSAHTVGPRNDDTVVAVGENFIGQCDVSGWTDIVQVAAGMAHMVGLKSDGTVVAAGWMTTCPRCEGGV
jgi:hypothetical protein